MAFISSISTSAGEVKVLDYQTQQYRLFPQLACSFAIFFSGYFIRKMYYEAINGINSGKTTLLNDLHSLGSGLKAVSSWKISQGIEQCRMACGGHGYSAASGLPSLYTNAVGGCTYEGENIVMLLQCARSLMKLAPHLQSVSTVSAPAADDSGNPVTGYLFVQSPPQRSRISQDSDPSSYLDAFEHLARQSILRAFAHIQQLKQRGRSEEEAWNEAGVELTKASKAHTLAFVARIFAQTVHQMADPTIRPVLTDLLWLFLSYELIHCAAGLLQDGFLSSQQFELVKVRMFDSLARIRPNAVAIVDSFDFSDRELRSVLGRRDGNVYGNLLKWAQQAPINDSDVLPFQEQYLGKAMREARAQRVADSKL